jgi:predicted Zn-ribbon and HTH transcriptional regulator
MNRPLLEVADIVRQAGPDYIERHRSQLAWPHLKVLQAIQNCRTAALGGHLDRCTQCGYCAPSYNSCRNRHCPKCQMQAREQWLAARSAELLPVPYFHVVFTLPRALSALVLQNKRLLYNLLFRTSAETLLEVAADPKHLGAQIGFLSVLHTWGQRLGHHPHIHCVAPGGGVSLEGGEWKKPPRHGFFLPVRVLSRVFRSKFVVGLKCLFRRRQLQFHGTLCPLAETKLFRRFLRSLFQSDWVVYAKKPFGGPEHVLQYLARYTHRVAISNHRLLSFTNGQVTCRWKDYQHGNKHRQMTLSADEFLRRFLLHVLPRSFVRLRHFGFSSLWIPGQPPTGGTHCSVPSTADRSSANLRSHKLRSAGRRHRPTLSPLCRSDGDSGTLHRTTDGLPVRRWAEFS